MNVRCFPTEQLATVYVAAMIEGLMSQKSRPVLGLATGSTPVGLYQQLVDFHRQGLSFNHATTINLDEYVGLAESHPQSYHYFMWEHFFKDIDIPKDRIYLPNGMAENLSDECERYDEVLEQHPIDLQVLGIGRNGHIGFNEPDVSLKARTHVIRLTEDTMEANGRFFSGIGTVPTEAITMGIQSILQAKSVVLMAFGRDKAHAVQRALSGEVSTELPASFLQTHLHTTFVLDEEAASLLDYGAIGINRGRNNNSPIVG